MSLDKQACSGGGDRRRLPAEPPAVPPGEVVLAVAHRVRPGAALCPGDSTIPATPTTPATPIGWWRCSVRRRWLRHPDLAAARAADAPPRPALLARMFAGTAVAIGGSGHWPRPGAERRSLSVAAALDHHAVRHGDVPRPGWRAGTDRRLRDDHRGVRRGDRRHPAARPALAHAAGPRRCSASAHGAGTSRAYEFGGEEGSAAGLLMVLTGLFNLLVAPWSPTACSPCAHRPAESSAIQPARECKPGDSRRRGRG